MVSNFKFIPYFNIVQNFVENVRKSKWISILSWEMSGVTSEKSSTTMDQAQWFYNPLWNNRFTCENFLIKTTTIQQFFF